MANRDHNVFIKKLAGIRELRHTFLVLSSKSAIAFTTHRNEPMKIISHTLFAMFVSLGTAELCPGQNIQTFPVGEEPATMAFDGANIWETNSGEDTVTKLRASD